MIKDGEYIYLHHQKSNFMIPFQDGNSFSSHKGNIKFDNTMDFGDRVLTPQNEEFTLLRPSLIDLMMKVKRRTTIIYPKEAGMIILELGIEYGSKVIEIGTGSGSLTILLSRLVGPEGKIYSYERREEHQEIAIKNVGKFGKKENVEFFLKDDVETEGFGVTEADALFIDVPQPWDLVPSAYDALKMGAPIGTLSPNIEQIQKTVDVMTEIGFTRFRCLEILTRNIRVEKNKTRPFNRMIGHTGYLLFAQKAKPGQDASFDSEEI